MFYKGKYFAYIIDKKNHKEDNKICVNNYTSRMRVVEFRSVLSVAREKTFNAYIL